jgi:hypothetical protein
MYAALDGDRGRGWDGSGRWWDAYCSEYQPLFLFSLSSYLALIIFKRSTYRLDRNVPRSSSFPLPLLDMDERVIELVVSVHEVDGLR